jgi:hypothetical protein
MMKKERARREGHERRSDSCIPTSVGVPHGGFVEKASQKSDAGETSKLGVAVVVPTLNNFLGL